MNIQRQIFNGQTDKLYCFCWCFANIYSLKCDAPNTFQKRQGHCFTSPVQLPTLYKFSCSTVTALRCRILHLKNAIHIFKGKQVWTAGRPVPVPRLLTMHLLGEISGDVHEKDIAWAAAYVAQNPMCTIQVTDLEAIHAIRIKQSGLLAFDTMYMILANNLKCGLHRTPCFSPFKTSSSPEKMAAYIVFTWHSSFN